MPFELLQVCYDWVERDGVSFCNLCCVKHGNDDNREEKTEHSFDGMMSGARLIGDISEWYLFGKVRE